MKLAKPYSDIIGWNRVVGTGGRKGMTTGGETHGMAGGVDNVCTNGKPIPG